MCGESARKFPSVNNFEEKWSATRAVAIYIFTARGCQRPGSGKLPECDCGKIHALVWTRMWPYGEGTITKTSQGTPRSTNEGTYRLETKQV